MTATSQAPGGPAGATPPLVQNQRIGATETNLDTAGRPGGGRPVNRLAFLDALRGIAALAVALQHSAEVLWPAYLKFSIEVIRPGEFGVVLFFLCSGFIIPASVERHGSLAEFWIGRVFRLYPLYLFAVFAAVTLHYTLDRYFLSEAFLNHPFRALVVNVTMLQNFVGQPLVIGASWSLAYEMVFYLTVSLLFLARAHRRSVPTAVLLLCAAGGVSTYIPFVMVTNPSPQTLSTVLAVTFGGAFLAWSVVPGGVRDRLVAVGLVVAIVPLVSNRPEPMWFALLLFGSMFVGTVLYRATRGELSWRTATTVYAFALVVIVGVHRVNIAPHAALAGALATWKPEALTFLSAYAVFGVGLLLRHHNFPRALTYLGTISYSVYLMHVLVIYAIPWWGTSRPLTMLRWVALTLVASAITYRFVEKPSIDAGRWVARRRRATLSARSASLPN